MGQTTKPLDLPRSRIFLALWKGPRKVGFQETLVDVPENAFMAARVYIRSHGIVLHIHTCRLDATCDCDGFKYRGNCMHLNAMLQIVEHERAGEKITYPQVFEMEEQA